MAENPKQAVGSLKIPLHASPMIVEAEVNVIFASEGGRRYGSYNYREAPIEANTYISACRRHLTEFWELGEDIDSLSGFSHISKAIASLTVLRDAQITGMLIDDRPPPIKREHWDNIQKLHQTLCEKYPEPKPPVTAIKS